MQCVWEIFSIAVAVLWNPKVSDGAGVIEIRLVEYTNIFGLKSGNPQQCCDVMSTDPLQCRSQPCDPYFDFCLQNMTHTGCGLGQQTTSYTRDQDNIVFGANNNGPLRFPNPQFFDNQMLILVTVYDEDKGEGKPTDDKLDYMQQLVTYTPDFNGMHTTTLNFTLSGQVSNLTIQVNIRCGRFSYGNSCTKQCRSDKTTYTCNNNGDKVCLPGWTGASCSTNIDECVNNSCQNGATCKDDVNTYVCQCLGKFTGRYCENVITSSTVTPTLPSTRTSPVITTDLTSILPLTTSPKMTTSVAITTYPKLTTYNDTSMTTKPKLITTSKVTTHSKLTTDTIVTTDTSVTTKPKVTTSSKVTADTNFTTNLVTASSKLTTIAIVTTVTMTSTPSDTSTRSHVTTVPGSSAHLQVNTKSLSMSADKSSHVQSKIPTTTTATAMQSSSRASSILVTKTTLLSSSPKANQYGQNKMTKPDSSSDSSGSSPGPLIGGIFGGLVMVAGIVVVAFFFYKRKRERENQPPTKSNKSKIASPGPRGCGDGKSVHGIGDERGDSRIVVEDLEQADGSQGNSVIANKMTTIDF